MNEVVRMEPPAGARPAPVSYVEQYLRPLQQYLTDDNINEVNINPDGSIFVEVAGEAHMRQVDVTLSPQSIKQLGAQIAGETKNTLGVMQPIVSGRVMVWGAPLRVQVVVEPAIESGVSLSIRKYVTRILAPSDIGFVAGKQIIVDEDRIQRQKSILKMAERGQIQELMRVAIDDKFNILISGGTSSGKTTMARAMIAMAEPLERIITIEDAQELYPPHKNQVALIADRKKESERLPSRLLESCLRMRPDRIILGEIRGMEAYDFLEAINTGHPGAITTIHADSPSLALDRLAMMVMRAGVQMTHSEIINYACKTIDLVIQVGRRDGKRGILQVYLPSIEKAKNSLL
jgi:type IV secretion system protein VirB11